MNIKHKVYISVISHNQEDLIIDNFKSLDFQNDELDINLILIDNTNSKKLEKFANEKEHIYFADKKTRGFGENNNKAFEISKAAGDDIFIVCNPDIVLEENQLFSMIKSFIENKRKMGNVSCYYDKEKTILSNPDRHFPFFLNFVVSILFKKRFHYGTNYDVETPEWISGEFMIIKADIYKQLEGFDENFFMYVEDIDICFRAMHKGIIITHDKEFYVIHETQMDSRNVLSNSFKMHLKSVIRYLVKHKLYRPIRIAP